ncbi:hypothetical protein A2U01_0119319, partial [Trifolium medium]|nr:hypothetical protein [Trifolium medium]
MAGGGGGAIIKPRYSKNGEVSCPI